MVSRSRGAGCPYCFGEMGESLLLSRIYSEFQELFGADHVQMGEVFDSSGDGLEPDVYVSSHKIGIEMEWLSHPSDTESSREHRVRSRSRMYSSRGIVLFWLVNDKIQFPIVDESREAQYRRNEDHLISMMSLANCMLASDSISEEVREILQPYVDANILFNQEEYQSLIMSGSGPQPGESLGDLIRSGRYPELEHLLDQWDMERNNNLAPSDVAFSANQKVWWKCPRCGHGWETSVKNRTGKNTSCPKCSRRRVGGGNDLAAKIENENLDHLKKEWMEERNKEEFDLTLHDVTPASNKEVWWICENGHSWKARIANRVIRETGCPQCAGRRTVIQIYGEEEITQALNQNWTDKEFKRITSVIERAKEAENKLEYALNHNLAGQQRGIKIPGKLVSEIEELRASFAALKQEKQRGIEIPGKIVSEIEELRASFAALKQKKEILEKKLKLQQEIEELEKLIIKYQGKDGE